MIEFSKEPSSLFGSTLQGIQPKLYAMGLMYALNSRVSFRAEAKDDEETVSFPLFHVFELTIERTCLCPFKQTYSEDYPSRGRDGYLCPIRDNRRSTYRHQQSQLSSIDRNEMS